MEFNLSFNFQVVLVGILREYEVQSTRATYEIEDHTGKITAVWWLDTETVCIIIYFIHLKNLIMCNTSNLCTRFTTYFFNIICFYNVMGMTWSIIR